MQPHAPKVPGKAPEGPFPPPHTAHTGTEALARASSSVALQVTLLHITLLNLHIKQMTTLSE